MQKLYLARPRLENYLPFTSAALQLQSAFIAKNPYLRDRRCEMESAGDNSEYSRVHAEYHRSFRRIVEKFGYYDLYLIDDDSRNIVYDVSKCRDFATSLFEGPYRDSNLAKIVRRCLDTQIPDDILSFPISNLIPLPAVSQPSMLRVLFSTVRRVSG